MNTETQHFDMARLAESEKGEIYAMIGCPIAQVKSPGFYNRHFAENCLDAEMIPIEVSSGQVRAFFEELRGLERAKGCIVTVPHKQAAVASMDELSPRSKLLGAVNVVRVENGNLHGDMVDGLGFLVAVRSHGIALGGKRVALVGAGGAGLAIALALAASRVDELVIHEIDTKRHDSIRRILRKTYPDLSLSFELENLAGFDLIANASPVGMNDDKRLPFPVDGLSSETLVMDAITKPKLTPWLSAARDKECDVIYGAEMVYGQIGLMGRHMGLSIPDPVDCSIVV